MPKKYFLNLLFGSQHAHGVQTEHFAFRFHFARNFVVSFIKTAKRLEETNLQLLYCALARVRTSHIVHSFRTFRSFVRLVKRKTKIEEKNLENNYWRTTTAMAATSVVVVGTISFMSFELLWFSVCFRFSLSSSIRMTRVTCLISETFCSTNHLLLLFFVIWIFRLRIFLQQSI